jgi:predicted nucleotide-binding protein (sugar kinase/HSP70/actin superfamily)
MDNKRNSKLTVLIPAMLDFHFPLLKYAFCSDNYNAVILEYSKNIAKTGLEYSHNDLCYPVILIIGQMITALKSGDYDGQNIAFMIPQAGDACRGSNYIFMIRKAMKRAGFKDVPIISLNFKGLEDKNRLKINIGMIRRGLAAVMYGDILMILRNQIKANEKKIGETDILTDKWTEILKAGIINGKLLSANKMKETFEKIAFDFSKIEKRKNNKAVIGIVGELYVKYCHLGNHNLCSFFENEGCGFYINGFSWYLLYYLDTHLAENSIMGFAYKGVMNYLEKIQKSMTDSIKKYGFICSDEFKDFKKNSAEYVSFGCNIADGWLIGGEIVNMHKAGIRKVACVQPFGCMPNHVFGKGIYSSLQRRLDGIMISCFDYDSGSSGVNIDNRARMLIDM